jgi:hypothetical protein
VPRAARRRIGCWLALVLLIVTAAIGWRELKRLERERPELFPWTELSLADPIGPFTGIKLARLTDQRARCLGLLNEAGLAETLMPPRVAAPAQCRFDDGVRMHPESRRSIAFAPAGLVTSCPVAAALALWEREVVQPAAMRHFGERVSRIDHAGSFSCRRLYGRSTGQFSEHATADAVDITGFRLADGRTISVLGDWRGDPAQTAFLSEVRDRACDLFATTLSPDYNRAHADHFHLDQAERGAMGWTICR